MLDQVALYFNNIIIHFHYYCSNTCFYIYPANEFSVVNPKSYQNTNRCHKISLGVIYELNSKPKLRIDVMFVFHSFCHNVFIVFERFLCFIVRFLVCVYKCYYIYVIKRGLFCYDVTIYIFTIFCAFDDALLYVYFTIQRFSDADFTTSFN